MLCICCDRFINEQYPVAASDVSVYSYQVREQHLRPASISCHPQTLRRCLTWINKQHSMLDSDVHRNVSGHGCSPSSA